MAVYGGWLWSDEIYHDVRSNHKLKIYLLGTGCSEPIHNFVFNLQKLPLPCFDQKK